VVHVSAVNMEKGADIYMSTTNRENLTFKGLEDKTVLTNSKVQIPLDLGLVLAHNNNRSLTLLVLALRTIPS